MVIEAGRWVVRSPRVSARLHHLDALRALAMLLGILLHAALAYTGGPWIVRDGSVAGLGVVVGAIHGFRMQLFFLLSGFFTAMLWRRRGLRAMLRQRASRIALPLLLGMVVIVPLVWATISWAAAAQGQAGAAAVERDPDIHPPLAVALWLLFRFPLLHHLWFLWFLCWMVAGLAAAITLCPASIGMRVRAWLGREYGGAAVWLASSGALVWLVPLTVLSHALMAPTREGPDFGANTSTGLLPLPGVLVHYALFFAFGAALELVPHGLARFSRRWTAALVLAIALLPVGMSFSFDAPWTRAAVPQPWAHAAISWALHALYAWTACIAAIGLFGRLMPTERPIARYLADSSYWLYLAHLPLVVAGQVLLLRVPWPPLAKLVVLLTGSTALLLASYALLVRHTVLGRLLNGPRARA
jgi:glucan biosynthesis protein C